MIVREIKQAPEQVLKTFDWFNDYKDTRSWAVDSFPEIVARLDEGFENYLTTMKPWSGDDMQTFMIGQRIIYNNIICTVIPTPDYARSYSREKLWINNPAEGYDHWVSLSNVKPLPGGQL